MNKFFSLLGLCKRAGKLVAGEVAAEQAVRKKQAYLLILAQDASKNTKKKFTNKCKHYDVPILITSRNRNQGRTGQSHWRRNALHYCDYRKGLCKKTERACG